MHRPIFMAQSAQFIQKPSSHSIAAHSRPLQAASFINPLLTIIQSLFRHDHNSCAAVQWEHYLSKSTQSR